jgi:hypothetical protein
LHRPSHNGPIRDEAISNGRADGLSDGLGGKTAGPPVSRRGLQRFQFQIIVRRPDVLDRARSPPGAVHDLHRPRPRRRRHGAHVGHNPTGYEIDLVRQFGRARQRIRRSTPQSHFKINNLAKVRSHRASVDAVLLGQLADRQLLPPTVPSDLLEQLHPRPHLTDLPADNRRDDLNQGWGQHS